MPQYMLLLYSDLSGFKALSPDEMQKAVEKYTAWTKKPFTTGSQRLGGDVGRVMRSKNGQPHIADGPYSETKEMLAGYYTIEAANYDEAVQRSLDHPHFEYGGTIEGRQVFGTGRQGTKPCHMTCCGPRATRPQCRTTT